MDEFLLKFNKNKKLKKSPFVIEPSETNVLYCMSCNIDTFMYWIHEEKKNNTYFSCLRCAIKNIDNIIENPKKFRFYYKYEKSEIYKLFSRLEKRIHNPSIKDDDFQVPLLLKTNWPQVRTKQQMIEEGLHPNFYGNSTSTDSL